MKVSLAHMIPAPFAQQVARALHEADALDRFLCTLVDQPAAAWQRRAKQAFRLAGHDLGRDLSRRAITEIPPEFVQCYPWRETVRMVVSKALGNKLVDDYVFHWAISGFERWAGQRLQNEDAVYGYEYVSRGIFNIAKQRGIRCIYDLPSPEHDYVESILAPEYERFPELKTPYRQKVLRKQVERTEKRREEWEVADLVVANSTFTAKSWQAAGWSEKVVAVIPYGAPDVPDVAEDEGSRPTETLQVLWAGTFGIRKGAHYLIEALRQMPTESTRHLKIRAFGAVTLPEKILACDLQASLELCGSVPRQELFQEMQRSDVLVFPTLCDGFGLIVNEAFANGLPVITTNRAGAADLIEHGKNGFLIEAGSAPAIRDILQRCLDERELLAEMRAVARVTARRWQWTDYRRAVQDATAKLPG